MSGPVALVTGAARGIGAATVAALVANDWSVVATDSCEDNAALRYPLGTRADLDAVVARGGDAVVGLVADVRDQDAMDRSVRTAIDRFGRLDAAIAVAGVLAGGTETWQGSEEAWHTQLDVNLTGVWRLAKAATPALIEANTTSPLGHSSFVAVSSAAGRRGLPMLGAYAASKHGVIGLVTSMAAELGRRGVTANVVCPGSTRTPILDASAAVYDLDDAEELATHHLLPRLLEPAEVAEAIVFLCSAGASAMTGAVIPVDAGMGAH